MSDCYFDFLPKSTFNKAVCGGSKTPSRTIDANLDCAFVENAFVFVVPNIGVPSWYPLNYHPDAGNGDLRDQKRYWWPEGARLPTKSLD